MLQRGFTLIELMFAIVMFTIVLMVGFGFLNTETKNLSIGYNGVTETRCIDGYKFIIGERGRPTQMLDHHGNGISCETLK